MPILSVNDQRTIARMNSVILKLLQLDESWTAAAIALSTPNESTPGDATLVSPEDLQDLVTELRESLSQMDEYVSFLKGISARLSDADEEEGLDAIFWSDDLSDADRQDLRWLVTRSGGLSGLADSAAGALAAWPYEVSLIDQAFNAIVAGEESTGDFTRKFRCGLGQGLLIGGILSFVASGSGAAGTAAAVAAAGGAAVGAAVLVGVTGGILGIAVVGAGLLFMRKMKC